MSLSSDIKEFALDLGYHGVGIAPADPFHDYIKVLDERNEDYARLQSLRKNEDPHSVFPEGRSLILAVYDYHSISFPPEMLGKAARFHLARCYVAPTSRIQGVRPELFRQFMESKGVKVAPWTRFRSGLPEKLAAARAGVGQYGDNCVVYARGVGTFVMVHGWIVDRELEYDRPHTETHCPPGCRLCIDACPTGALKGGVRLNPRQCICYNTIRNRGGETGISIYTPKEIRPKTGTWIHGCDVCQEVCPKNAHKMRGNNLPASPFLEARAKDFDLVSILRMTDEYYENVIGPILYTHITPAERVVFRRNAAVALGNLGDSAAVPALCEALDDPAEVLRAHAAWALGRIGGSAARSALEAHRRSETGVEARREIEEALAEMVN